MFLNSSISFKFKAVALLAGFCILYFGLVLGLYIGASFLLGAPIALDFIQGMLLSTVLPWTFINVIAGMLILALYPNLNVGDHNVVRETHKWASFFTFIVLCGINPWLTLTALLVAVAAVMIHFNCCGGDQAVGEGPTLPLVPLNSPAGMAIAMGMSQQTQQRNKIYTLHNTSLPAERRDASDRHTEGDDRHESRQSTQRGSGPSGTWGSGRPKGNGQKLGSNDPQPASSAASQARAAR